MSLSAIERQMDIVAKLAETDEAITALGAMGVAIPPEAIELRTIMRRAIAAEADLSTLRAVAARITPGPYRWGIFEEATSFEMAAQSLSFGSGDVHLVTLPKHPRSKQGDDPMRPEHEVALCMTGNGPDSEPNARALVELLTRLSPLAAALAPSGGDVKAMREGKQ